LHTCAVKVDGSLWCWGDNDAGQLGLGDTSRRNTPQMVAGITDVVSVSSGGAHTCAIKVDGSLWCWGNNEYGQLGLGYSGGSTNTPHFVTSGVSSVSLGYEHTCAVKTDGSLWCWGHNGYGQLGLGDNAWRNTPRIVLGGVIEGEFENYPSPAPRYIFAFGDNVLTSGFGRGSGFEIENLGTGSEKSSYGCSSSSSLQILFAYLLLGLIIIFFALRRYRML